MRVSDILGRVVLVTPDVDTSGNYTYNFTLQPESDLNVK